MVSLLYVFLVSILLAFSSGCAPYLVVSGGVVNREKLQEVKMGLPRLRALDFKVDVPIEVKTQDEMKRYFATELEREYGDEKLKKIALAYSKLGLFPDGYDLKHGLLEFYGSQIAAFYDPWAKKLFLPKNLGSGVMLGAVQFLAQRDIMGEMVLAHELTHALQDQHFSLGERLSRSQNEDKTLALRAVIEGDATLSGFGYLFGGLEETSLAQATQSVQNSVREARSLLVDVPEAILEELLFQYYGGVAFVSRVVQQRGWLGVNFLYRFPPVSTEQILHPEKFFDKPDVPSKITLDDLRSLFSADWQEIENNVLGELMVRALFKRFHSEEQAEAGAEGWGGDRFVAFRRGEEIAFIWATLWDSSQDANEFFENYQEILSQKYIAPAARAARTFIEQRGQRVIVVEGLESEHVKSHIEKIWQGMALEPEPFNPFFSRLKQRTPQSP